ncbi:regulatory protein RecX [Rhodopila sp.]|uniref:regulatory protein RecX n=1 Tax=Rhodopila sp. TaxID=2480087 RepID=UPI003D14A88A
MPPAQTPPPPDAANLYQAALSYLARYAATEAGLRRVLIKRVDRWARTQADRDAAAPVIAAARKAIDAVIGKLVHAGAVSDASFAQGRVRSLLHTGRSRRAIQARLVAKGIAPDLARDAAGDDAGSELAAALVLTRRRRIGPFRAGEPADMAATQRKELGMLARAGFARDTAQQALRMDALEAERRIHALRSDQAIAD